jgi:hypothetical protein
MNEIREDLPPFLKPHAEQKARAEIEEWEKARRGLLEKREKFLEDYRISKGLDEEGKPRGEDKGNMGVEYKFETTGKGKWQVFLGKNTEYTPPPDLEDWQRAAIERDLTINQALGQTVSGQRDPQMLAVNFLEANWKTLAGIFSSGQAATGVEARSFTNVRVGGTVIDFLGIGPDGRYIVFEVAKPGRESQIEQWQRALRGLGIPEEMVTVFRIQCSAAATQTTLLIK